jgi:hypothetical protein
MNNRQQQWDMLDDAFRARVLFFREQRSPSDVSFFLTSEYTMMSMFWELVHPPAEIATLTMTIPALHTGFWDAIHVRPSDDEIEAALSPAEPDLDTNCVICQEPLHENCVQLHQCNHTFHNTCIRTWFQTSPRCPTCRNDIRTTTNTTNNEGGNLDADVQ